MCVVETEKALEVEVSPSAQDSPRRGRRAKANEQTSQTGRFHPSLRHHGTE